MLSHQLVSDIKDRAPTFVKFALGIASKSLSVYGSARSYLAFQKHIITLSVPARASRLVLRNPWLAIRYRTALYAASQVVHLARHQFTLYYTQAP